MSKILLDKLNEAKSKLKLKISDFPKTVIVLGSGLNGLLEEIVTEHEISYSDIPYCRPSTVEGHVGRLIVGKLDNIRIACMQGRLHYYEGYSMEEVVFPFRLFAYMGAETFVLTNAAGGVHSDMSPLDLVLIRDHINLMGTNPLIGSNDDKLGTRFPDMTEAYDSTLRRLFEKVAFKHKIPIRVGVYLGIHGPSFETPAEVNMCRTMGADVIGMSTIPEVIALKHMGKKIAAISCVTNLAAGVGIGPLAHDDVMKNAKKAFDRFSKLIRESIKEIEKTPR